jgi:hypothetical protein
MANGFMTTYPSHENRPTPKSPLDTLSEHLRDGPLQRLIELQLRTHELGTRHDEDQAMQIEELGELVLLSLRAMEQFHAFTQELQGLLQNLTDAGNSRH